MSRLFARAYERLGWRWVVASILGVGVLAQFQLVLTLFLEVKYLRVPAGDAAEFIAIGFGYFLAVLGLGLLTCLHLIVPPTMWLRAGKPSDTAAAIWRSSIRAGQAIVSRGALAYAIGAVPFHLLISPEIIGSSTAANIALVLFGWVAILTAWIVLTSVAELMFRPLVRDLASRLPSSEDEPPPGWPLRVKAVVTVPVAAFYGALAAGAFVFSATSPEARLYVALAAAGVVTVSFALPVAAIATGSVLEPVKDLIDATRRVARGDFSARVPILTDDELADLARSLNVMQQGLIERESFRDRNLELIDELKASRARIVAASSDARRKVERDLHDGAQQHLVLLNLKLAMAERAVAGGDPNAKEMVAEARIDLGRALEELRDLAHGIYPQVLASDGIGPALAEAARDAAIPTSVECDGAGRSPPELEAAVYFCCLEALQNAAKHAGEGAKATISLVQANGELRFDVADDGRGFDPAAADGSSGLQGMADRIGALGGELSVESERGRGTRVVGRVPVTGGLAG